MSSTVRWPRTRWTNVAETTPAPRKIAKFTLRCVYMRHVYDRMMTAIPAPM
jgi:hypothetical protein